MLGQPTDYWGKTGDESRGRQTWHPLLHHSADVAACCEALLRHTILGRRLAGIAGQDDLDEVQLARLCVFAALHDFGKFTAGFQDKALPGRSPAASHVQDALALLAEGGQGIGAELFKAIPVAELLRWSESPFTVQQIFVAAICHHGRPFRLGAQVPPDSRHWADRHGRSPFDGIRELWESAVVWFPDAVRDGRPLPANPAFQHAYAGVVNLADWLGSSELFFPFSGALDEDRMPMARRRAREALARIGLDPAAARAALGAAVPGFDRFADFETPHEAQRAVWSAPIDGTARLMVLEAETGSGKTEAAYARFLRLFHAGEVDGMYFALPTRTAATQIHARITTATERAFPVRESRPPVLLAVPRYLRVDDMSGRLLPGFEVLWDEDVGERYRYRGWAAESSKRFLAGSIVVGTIDQALMSALQVPHAHLRAAAPLASVACGRRGSCLQHLHEPAVGVRAGVSPVQRRTRALS